MDKCKNITGVFFCVVYIALRNIISDVESYRIAHFQYTKKFGKGKRSFFKNQMYITSTMTLDDRKGGISFSIHDDSDFLKHFD